MPTAGARRSYITRRAPSLLGSRGAASRWPPSTTTLRLCLQNKLQQIESLPTQLSATRPTAIAQMENPFLPNGPESMFDADAAPHEEAPLPKREETDAASQDKQDSAHTEVQPMRHTHG